MFNCYRQTWFQLLCRQNWKPPSFSVSICWKFEYKIEYKIEIEIWILWSHKILTKSFCIPAIFCRENFFWDWAPYASTIMICNICFGLFWHNDAVLEIAVQLNLLFWVTVASLHCITTIYCLLLVSLLKIWLLVINSVLEVVMLVPLKISPTGSTWTFLSFLRWWQAGPADLKAPLHQWVYHMLERPSTMSTS